MTPWQAHLMKSAINAMKRDSEERKVKMAKQEIIKRTANPFRNIWWKFMPGETITTKWPSLSWTDQDHLGNQTWSSDPNDHWRPWLEQNVGKQGWDWDWRIGQSGFRYDGERFGDILEIKFRKKHRGKAVEFVLKWA